MTSLTICIRRPVCRGSIRMYQRISTLFWKVCTTLNSEQSQPWILFVHMGFTKLPTCCRLWEFHNNNYVCLYLAFNSSFSFKWMECHPQISLFWLHHDKVCRSYTNLIVLGPKHSPAIHRCQQIFSVKSICTLPNSWATSRKVIEHTWFISIAFSEIVTHIKLLTPLSLRD